MIFKLLTRAEELPDFSPHYPVFSDIETDGLYINTRLIQVYQPQTSEFVYIIDLAPIGYNESSYNSFYRLVKEWLKPLHTVWWGGSYDLGTLNINTEHYSDLMYAVRTAYPEFQKYNLDVVLEKLGFGHYYEGLDKKKLQKQGFVKGAYLSQQQLKYSALDVFCLEKIWNNKKVQSVINNNTAYKVDILSQRYAFDYQQNGLDVDLKRREELLIENTKEADRLQSLLPSGLNVNSPKQVKELLGTNSSDKATLIHLASQQKGIDEGIKNSNNWAHLANSFKLPKLAKTILELKKVKKNLSYLNSIGFSKMYSKFNVSGAATGRFTASGGDLPNGCNLQQIPRHLADVFGIEKDGDMIMIGADYATLELRLACAIYNEPNMYKIFKDDKDLHYETAAGIYGKTEIDPEERNNAKPVNFGFTFGMSPSVFKEYAFVMFGQSYTNKEAEDMRNKFFTSYPSFKRYHNQTWKDFQKGGLVVKTALGRRVCPRMGTDAINLPVQGSGAECTKLSVHYMVKENPDTLKYIVNVIHDCIVMKVPKSEKDYWKELLGRCMEKGWNEISKTSLFHFKDIPMPIEVNEGYTYKDVK